MLAANIPQKFPIPFAQNAGPSYVRNIPTSSLIGVVTGAASLNDGFVPLNFTPISGGGVPPFGQDMNGILRQMSAWNRWQGAAGPVNYDATFSSDIGGYPLGACLASQSLNGSFWLSLVDNNTTNPDAGGANWVGFTPISLYAVDTGTANAAVASLVPAPVSLASLTGMAVRIKKVSIVNGGAVTLALNTFPNTPVVHADGTQIVAGELPAGGIFSVVFDGAAFQLQSIGQAGGISPPQLQAQAGNYAVDTGTANGLVITLNPVPPSLASIIGSPIRILKSGAVNTSNVTLNVNGLGSQNILWADGSVMLAGELPAGGLFEVAWDGSFFTLMSPPIPPVATATAATAAQMEAAASSTVFASPANMVYSDAGIKGHIFFHWNGSTIVTDHKSSTVALISRIGVGHYQVTMQGGLNFTFGYAVVNGGGITPANAGGIATGRKFTGLNPTFDIYFGDSGGSGGEASDPPDAGVLIFGTTQN